MKQILILGAGKSSSYLIKYLSELSDRFPFQLTIIDINISLIPPSVKTHPYLTILELPHAQISDYKSYIEKSDITISMLPAFMHIDIAKLCLEYHSHLITPSYVSESMCEMHDEVRNKKLIFLNEMGFDPGIDHLTTMKIYHEMIEKGAELISYKSYAGGLVAPKNDNNPWHYKFSWNPRNVILAGQGGSILYKEHKKTISLDYNELFANSEVVQLNNGLVFDAYANRNSLNYEKTYGWNNIDTLLRGTLRIQGFCKAWNILIQLGLTDDTILHTFSGNSYQEFYQYFTKASPTEFLAKYSTSISEKLEYIGFKDNQSIIEKDGTAAAILQSILEKKWKLQPEDTDWIIMIHKMIFKQNDKKYEIESSLSLEGEDNVYTAMSKTVGLPIAFAAEMILNDEIKEHGVIIPISKDIYRPIIGKLERVGVRFQEHIQEI